MASGVTYNTPLAPPPAGVKSNFEDPETDARAIIVTNIVMLVFATFFVGVRLYTKARITRSIGIDDYLCSTAFALAIAQAVMSILSTFVGFGKHAWDVRAVDMTPTNFHIITSQAFLYYLTIMFVKLSILAFYLRLFSIERRLARLVYGGMAVIAVGYLAFTVNAIVLLVECDHGTRKSFCSNQYLQAPIGAAFNTISDFYVLLLPINRVWTLQTTRRRKIGILVVLMVGFVASIAGIVRLVLACVGMTSLDTLYHPGVNELNVIEADLGIMACCMPAFPSFFAKAAVFQSSTYRTLLYERLLPRRFSSSSAKIPQGDEKTASAMVLVAERQRTATPV